MLILQPTQNLNGVLEDLVLVQVGLDVYLFSENMASSPSSRGEAPNFCQLQQRCAPKPFSVKKLALFSVVTCLSLST